MATLYDDSALNALNEKDYINKLYDSNTDAAKKLLQESYTNNSGFLNNEQNRVQQQTQENVNRTQVEAQTAQDQYTGPKLTLGASQQEALSRGNAQQANVTSLQQKQSDADAEIERQRQLLASQYSTAIKQAQADNDMQRAQQLYNAAKEEEAKLLALRQNASSVLAEKGDTSIRDALLRGETPSADYSGQTWEQVLKNEAALNEIYNKQLESERLGLQMEYEEDMSDLAAKQRKEQAKTDRDLTQTYVDALQKMKNYAEVQTAYGQGSGTAAAARIAQDTELQNALTNLRGVQMGRDADIGMEGLDISKDFRDRLYGSQDEINRKRAEELLKAAEQEEENLYNIQQQIGQQLARENNWSILGKLYGLNQDQIDRIQGTGAYAPVYYGGGGDDGGSSGSGSPGANKSIIQLGYGPISNATLANKVASGQVNVSTSGGKVTYSNNPGRALGSTYKSYKK
jgi:hypothetical protein